MIPILLLNLGGSEAIWGLSAMLQIKTKHKPDFKQNLQSFRFSSTIFDCQKKNHANAKDTID